MALDELKLALEELLEKQKEIEGYLGECFDLAYSRLDPGLYKGAPLAKCVQGLIDEIDIARSERAEAMEDLSKIKELVRCHTPDPCGCHPDCGWCEACKYLYGDKT